MYELEIVNSEVEHKDLKIVSNFSLHYPTWGMLNLYYIFSDKHCDVKKSEYLKMYNEFLFLATSEHNLFVCIRIALKKQLNSMQSGDCTDQFSAKSTKNFFPPTCYAQD